MYIEQVIIRGEIYEFEFNYEPTLEELKKVIIQAMDGIGGRPRDRG
jgi:hypothetical protein